jgi:hypothetical protein
MANADMKRLIDNVRVRCPGALDSVIFLELFTVLDDFLHTTNMWKEDITFAVVASQLSYLTNPGYYTFDICPLDGGAINTLLQVTDNNGIPVPATMQVPGTIILQRLPSANATFTAKVGKSITDPVQKDGTPEVPEWIIGKYGSSIMEGVNGRMWSQIAKPYSAPGSAKEALQNYQQARSAAKTETLHQNNYRGHSWWFPQTYAARGQRL